MQVSHIFILFVPMVCHYKSWMFCFRICRMHILAPFLLAGAWYLGRNHLICYFDFSPSWRPAIYSKFFHVCVCTHTHTHTKVLFFIPRVPFPKISTIFAQPSKVKIHLPVLPMDTSDQDPETWLPLLFHQAWNESLRTSRCFAASYESAQGQHPEVTGWDGHRITQLTICSLCVLKNPCCTLLLWKIWSPPSQMVLNFTTFPGLSLNKDCL